MSTDPRTELRDKIANAIDDGLFEARCPHGARDPDWCIACAADAVLAALDLDARDARVRAEALREHAAYMREKADNMPEDVARRPRWPWTGYLTAAKHAEQAADEIAPASPSSSPVEAPSRPTGTPEPPEPCTTCWVCRGTEPDEATP